MKERQAMESVAPLPTGGGVTVIAEHRGRREQDGKPETEGAGDAAADGRAETVDPAPAPHHELPPPITEEELVPAETLFAATLMANAMPPSNRTTEELRRRSERGWTPPDSPLRLKDKLI
jgi:hypothetical protein